MLCLLAVRASLPPCQHVRNERVPELTLDLSCWMFKIQVHYFNGGTIEPILSLAWAALKVCGFEF